MRSMARALHFFLQFKSRAIICRPDDKTASNEAQEWKKKNTLHLHQSQETIRERGRPADRNRSWPSVNGISAKGVGDPTDIIIWEKFQLHFCLYLQLPPLVGIAAVIESFRERHSTMCCDWAIELLHGCIHLSTLLLIWRNKALRKMFDRNDLDWFGYF